MRKGGSRNLTGSVVVIVGASSGIGRATAEGFARRGAKLVLAARGQEGLQATAQSCQALGASCSTVACDIGEPSGAQAILVAAIERYGHIDVWVNNAGVGAVGLFDETPMAAHERIITTNLVGYMHGAHAAIGHFKARGQGVLINTLSLGAFVPAPYASAYSASKFGLRAFTESLRGELSGVPTIQVCDVFPTFVDTPGMAHGANYVGRAIKPPPPVVGPQAVARAIISAAERPRSRIIVGRATTALARTAHALAPDLTMRIMRIAFVGYFTQAREVACDSGNLFRPSVGGSAEGGFRSPLGRAAVALVAAAGGVVAIRLAMNRVRARA